MSNGGQGALPSLVFTGKTTAPFPFFTGAVSDCFSYAYDTPSLVPVNLSVKIQSPPGGIYVAAVLNYEAGNYDQQQQPGQLSFLKNGSTILTLPIFGVDPSESPDPKNATYGFVGTNTQVGNNVAIPFPFLPIVVNWPDNGPGAVSLQAPAFKTDLDFDQINFSIQPSSEAMVYAGIFAWKL